MPTDPNQWILALQPVIIAALAALGEIGRRLLRAESRCQRRLKAIGLRVKALEAAQGKNHTENVERLDALADRMPPAS